MITNRFPIFRRIAWVGLATALLFSIPFATAQDDDKQQHQLSDKVSDALQKLKPLQDAKNYSAMMAIVDSTLGQVQPTSYDAAYLYDVKARLYVGMEKYDSAIEPWEQALNLSDQFHYFDERQSQDLRKFVAQLLFSEAINSKEKAVQRRDVNASAQYLKAYLAHTPKPEADTQMLYAQILYYRATSDEGHIDQAALKEARQIVEEGLKTAVHPRESFYLLLLTIMQQQNDNTHAAQVMEVVLRSNPNRKDIWPTLFSTYYNLASTSKEGSDQQRDYFIRAIVTIERAQKYGFMNTPRDNYNLFTLYVAAGQPSIATDLLYHG
ncbi:MAG: tetratricopeptide repeat protein, partial [Candidatus Acidiferrales bacterium]